MSQLPSTGYLRVEHILGCKAVTAEEAKQNRERNKQAELEAIAAGSFRKNGKPKFTRLPTTPRVAIPAIVPVKKSTWWQGIKDQRYPPAVKIGARCTAWKVEDILNFLAKAGDAE